MLANNWAGYEDIPRSTAGIIFLGTPHGGSGLAAYASFLAEVRRNDASLLNSLNPTSEQLYTLAHDFAKGFKHVRVVCFYEKLRNSFVGGLANVEVSRRPACLYISLIPDVGCWPTIGDPRMERVNISSNRP